MKNGADLRYSVWGVTSCSLVDYPADGGSRFLCNVGRFLPDCTVSVAVVYEKRIGILFQWKWSWTNLILPC